MDYRVIICQMQIKIAHWSSHIYILRIFPPVSLCLCCPSPLYLSPSAFHSYVYLFLLTFLSLSASLSLYLRLFFYAYISASIFHNEIYQPIDEGILGGKMDG